MLMLATARRLPYLDREVREGRFSVRLEPSAMGSELDGKTAGVVGFGRIGQRFAAMCRDALHMPVLAYDPYVDPGDIERWGATPVGDLHDLAAQVDILSIHVPLTPSTHYLLDERVIRALKPGAIVINTSRGPVVDEEPLVEALVDGHLAGAGLDVFDPQPPAADNPLLALDQVVLTPHVASNTGEGRLRMGMTVVEDILRALRGERPCYLANPEVWHSRRTLIS
jgi:phosphoglycerate dehydrogenase-like enzyme